MADRSQDRVESHQYAADGLIGNKAYGILYTHGCVLRKNQGEKSKPMSLQPIEGTLTPYVTGIHLSMYAIGFRVFHSQLLAIRDER